MNGNLVRSVLVIILSSVLLAGLAWTVNSLLDSNTKIQVLELKIETLEGSIKDKTLDRFTSEDADRKFDDIDEELKELELRIRKLEQK